MSDHTLYNFTHGNGDAPRQLRVYFNIETIVRGYLAYQSMWVAVGKNCHAKLTHPEEVPFAVSVMAKNFRGLLARCLYNKIGQSFVELLYPWLKNNPPGFLNSLEFLEEVLQERIFASYCLITKITKISALWKFPTIQYIINVLTTIY